MLGIRNELSLDNTRLVRVAVKPDIFKREDFLYRVYIQIFTYMYSSPKNVPIVLVFNPHYGFLVNKEKEL